LKLEYEGTGLLCIYAGLMQVSCHVLCRANANNRHLRVLSWATIFWRRHVSVEQSCCHPNLKLSTVHTRLNNCDPILLMMQQTINTRIQSLNLPVLMILLRRRFGLEKAPTPASHLPLDINQSHSQSCTPLTKSLFGSKTRSPPLDLKIIRSRT
jgi:hypothetical protein